MTDNLDRQITSLKCVKWLKLCSHFYYSALKNKLPYIRSLHKKNDLTFLLLYLVISLPSNAEFESE